jgi:Flp pilus assembly protein TadD
MRFATWTLVASLALVGCGKKPAPEAPVSTPTVVQPDPSASDATDAPRSKPDEPAISEAQLRRRVDEAVGQLTVGTPDAARRALDVLELVAQKDARNAYVFFNMGVAHTQLGALTQAERAFTKAIEIDPGLGRAYMGLGVVLEQQDRSAGAADWYRKGIKADDDDMELRSALIGLLRRQGRLDSAIAEARAALAINSKSLPIYNDLGLVYIDKGDLSMARFVFLKALGQVEGAKNNASIRANFGRALYLDDDPMQARRQLEEAYKLDQRYLPTLVYLSRTYLDDRNFADAIPLLEEAQRQEPDNFGVTLNLGIAYRGVNRLEDAKRTYQKALEIQPSSPDPWLNIGVLEGDYFKNYAAATAAFQTYLDNGGTEKERVTGYIEDIEKEQTRAARQKEKDAERQKREKERLERERLLREAEKKAGGAPTPPGGQE